jgi:hypothetical protein
MCDLRPEWQGHRYVTPVDSREALKEPRRAADYPGVTGFLAVLKPGA